MACNICGVVKLSNEFPPECVKKECKHAILACLRCTLQYVEKNGKCPHEGCSNPASTGDKQLQWFQAILDTMFKEYHPVASNPSVGSKDEDGGKLYVTSLTGDSLTFDYNPNLTIQDLKIWIKSKLGHEVEKQKLLYDEKELKHSKPDGKLTTMCDFNVPPEAKIYLVVLLYAIPEGFDHVVFDLFWGYPTSGKDYLDASCLTYTGLTFHGVSDFRHSELAGAVRHSGDVMDNANRIGHHTIHVHLKSLPASVTHLFFTLSAWSYPNISKYPNPSLKFYEASAPNKNLCKTTFTHAGSSQAVVMCSVSRGQSGTWQIFESGKLSSGNANNYEPLKTTILSLIKQGF